MSDSSALDTIDGLDYEEIEQAVMETSRGRWFLTEFARRHKAADTAVLLDAIRRLESQIQSMSADASAPPEAEQVDAQASSDSDESSDYEEIADKLDRTTQLVRRLRSSHKLIGEAADKPLSAPKTVPANLASAAAAGDPPGFVGSDDDIFADNSAHASEPRQQPDATPEEAESAPDTVKSPPISGDTLNFANLDVTDVTARQNAADAGDDSSSDHPEQHTETVPVSTQVDEPATPDTSAAPDDTEPAEKPKKRIIVIRRPADHPGDIPLADSAPELPGDSPSAA